MHGGHANGPFRLFQSSPERVVLRIFVVELDDELLGPLWSLGFQRHLSPGRNGITHASRQTFQEGKSILSAGGGGMLPSQTDKNFNMIDVA